MRWFLMQGTRGEETVLWIVVWIFGNNCHVSFFTFTSTSKAWHGLALHSVDTLLDVIDKLDEQRSHGP
jgi:hypothetical protein